MRSITPETSPLVYARAAAVFQLLEALTATFGHVILPGYVVPRDAAATAANIVGNEPVFWWGFASTLVGVLFHIAWIYLIHLLLKPVNRNVSRIAVCVMLVGCVFQALTALLYLAPVRVLSSGSALSAFTTEQLQALAYTFIQTNALAFDIYLVFFGCWCVLIGYLVFNSTFLPRILGAMLVIEGVGWMTFLSPSLGRLLLPAIFVAIVLAELPLLVWLLVKGVNIDKWKEKAIL